MTQHIDIGAPASLLLGFAPAADGAPTLFGATLRHPPVHLMAQRHHGVDITGARAHIARAQARRFWAQHELPARVEAQIELTIPAYVGLGADAMLGLAMGRALAWLSELPFEAGATPDLATAIGLDAAHALEIWGFDQGGWLQVAASDGDLAAPQRRAPITHRDNKAWAFVMVLPRTPADTPADFERSRLDAVLRAAPGAGEATAILADAVWPAIEADDIHGLADGLARLQASNAAALAAAGAPPAPAPEQADLLALMRDQGALFAGQSLTGSTLYALVEGAQASQDLRVALQTHVGHFGGDVMATITDNDGARHKIHDRDLHHYDLPPIRPA